MKSVVSSSRPGCCLPGGCLTSGLRRSTRPLWCPLWRRRRLCNRQPPPWQRCTKPPGLLCVCQHIPSSFLDSFVPRAGQNCSITSGPLEWRSAGSTESSGSSRSSSARAPEGNAIFISSSTHLVYHNALRGKKKASGKEIPLQWDNSVMHTHFNGSGGQRGQKRQTGVCSELYVLLA